MHSKNSQSIWGRLTPVATHEGISLNRTYEFGKAKITIGRRECNDITLSCPLLSGNHCKIIRKFVDNEANPVQILLQDTSTNGTWNNKSRVRKKTVAINDGCEITLIPGSKKRHRRKLSYFFRLNMDRIIINNFTVMRHADEYSKYIVSGYLRELDSNILALIYQSCLSYYFIGGRLRTDMIDSKIVCTVKEKSKIKHHDLINEVKQRLMSLTIYIMNAEIKERINCLIIQQYIQKDVDDVVDLFPID